MSLSRAASDYYFTVQPGLLTVQRKPTTECGARGEPRRELAQKPKTACQRKPTAPLAQIQSERRDKGPFARILTALRSSRPVQDWVFHQPRKELTTLPVLRYGSGHRKVRLKFLFISKSHKRAAFSCFPQEVSPRRFDARTCFFLPLPFRWER